VDLAAVRELPAQRAAEETRRPEVLAELIFGSLAVAGPAVEPDLAAAGVQALVRAVGADPRLALEVEAVELYPGSVGVVALGRGEEQERAVEAAPSLDPVAVPGRAKELKRHQERAVEPIPSPDPATVLGRGADRDQLVVPAKESELERVVEAGQVQTQELSFPDSADGSQPRRC